MNEFILEVDEEKFKATNGPWNELQLNAPSRVGYVSTLIELGNFETKEEWEQFYYQSGIERIEKLKSGDYQSLEKLSCDYGRTIEEVELMGTFFQNHLVANGLDITVEDCIKIVKYRIIGETWNGIILRERNTIKTLNSLFPNLNFIKTTGEADHTYAVDYEVFSNAKLTCGLQVKPQSYTYNTPYIEKAREANRRKNNVYTERTGVPVLDVISTKEGHVLNNNVYSKIRELA